MFLKDGLGDHDLFSHSLFILTARSLFFKKKKKKKKQKVKIKKKDKVKGGGVSRIVLDCSKTIFF
jgi:hypothetical protein